MVDGYLNSLAPDTREVLAQGQKSMRELYLNFFGTEGLLLGLLAVETTPANQALKEQGVDFDRAQNLFRIWLGQCAVPTAKIPAEIPFTPRAYRVLELTMAQAKQQDAYQTTPEHLLLGILQEGEMRGGMAMRVLRECKVNCRKLKQRLQGF